MFLRTPYNYDTDEASFNSGLSCPDKSRAQQQFRDDSNPNFIMTTFAKTGDSSILEGGGSPQFGDFTGISNYHDAYNEVIAANDAFDALPSKIRNFFENEPANLLNFLADESNRDQAIELGLIDKPVATPRPTNSAVGVGTGDQATPDLSAVPASHKPATATQPITTTEGV